ncbi:MAG: VanZ family protein [Deltaproteobacteria bacterium]|nr:VanZ family protein [Deltaproteobacteria bacterium]
MQSSKKLSQILYCRLPVIALCIFIFWQSSYPGIISQPLFPYDDKVLHFGVYALLSILCVRDLIAEKPFWSPLKIKIAAVLFASLYGLSDEIHQAFVLSRCASVYDFLADVAGSMAGLAFYLNFISRK